MRRLLFAMVLVAAACGGSKKSSRAPAAQAPEGESERESETGARDESRPDDEDDMPNKAAEDPDAGGE